MSNSNANRSPQCRRLQMLQLRMECQRVQRSTSFCHWRELLEEQQTRVDWNWRTAGRAACDNVPASSFRQVLGPSTQMWWLPPEEASPWCHPLDQLPIQSQRTSARFVFESRRLRECLQKHQNYSDSYNNLSGGAKITATPQRRWMMFVTARTDAFSCSFSVDTWYIHTAASLSRYGNTLDLGQGC